MAARSTCAGGNDVLAAGAKPNRNLSGSKIADQFWNEKWGNPFEACLQEDEVILLDRAESADTVAY